MIELLLRTFGAIDPLISKDAVAPAVFESPGREEEFLAEFIYSALFQQYYEFRHKKRFTTYETPPKYSLQS